MPHCMCQLAVRDVHTYQQMHAQVTSVLSCSHAYALCHTHLPKLLLRLASMVTGEGSPSGRAGLAVPLSAPAAVRTPAVLPAGAVALTTTRWPASCSAMGLAAAAKSLKLPAVTTSVVLTSCTATAGLLARLLLLLSELPPCWSRVTGCSCLGGWAVQTTCSRLWRRRRPALLLPLGGARCLALACWQ